uniref:Uncharacterized protein n=1 Tax=Romanomermis culicivorax TaxID=13658 RepID=A0A915K383_ROMCU
MRIIQSTFIWFVSMRRLFNRLYIDFLTRKEAIRTI